MSYARRPAWCSTPTSRARKWRGCWKTSTGCALAPSAGSWRSAPSIPGCCYKLTGGRLHATDVTNASRTLLLDIGKVAWDDELLGRDGRARERCCPRCVPSSQVYAETDPSAFFGAAVPVAGAIGDQQAALFAQACFEQGTAKNTYGTGSFVLMNTGRDQITDQHVLLRTIAYGLEGAPVEYALEGLDPGDRQRRAVATRRARHHRAAQQKPRHWRRAWTSNDDVWFVPALAGLGAPHWDPAARGVLLGLTRGTTRAHVARAVLESIAWSTKDVIDAMQRESGVHLDELRVDGGATANRWLMQFQSDVLNLPLDVPDNTETTALGSGYLAGLATGVYANRDELARLRRTGRALRAADGRRHPPPAPRALDRGRQPRAPLGA